MALPIRSKISDDLYQPLANINVTPLVDVMLVLLIIFMLTAPLLATGMKIILPQAQAVRAVNPGEAIVVAVGKGGRITLGSQEVSADALIDRVRASLGGDANRVVYVRGDKEASYGDVISVVDKLASHHVNRVTILTSSPARTEAPKAAHPSGAAAGRGTPK